MANSSYVSVPTLYFRQVKSLLETVTKLLFKDQFFVAHAGDSVRGVEDHPVSVWFVTLRGPVIQDPAEASRRNIAPGDGFGFAMYFNHLDQVMEFRHPLNLWERWVQMRVEHTIAEMFNVTIKDDAQEEPIQPELDELKENFISYLARNMKRPLNAKDMRWLQDKLEYMPPGKVDTIAMLG